MSKWPSYDELKKKLTALEREVNACRSKLNRIEDDQQFFENLFEKAPFGHIVCNTSGEIIAQNSSAKEILPHLSGKRGERSNLFSLEPLKQVDFFMILTEYLSSQSYSYQSSMLTDDDRIIYLQWHFIPIKDKSGKLSGIQAIVNDISDQKRIETHLLQTHRLESIGALTSGIAHAFNNIIWIINSNLELAFGNLPAGNPARYHLEQAEAACLRAQEIVTQISNHSRVSNNHREQFDLCPLVKESIKFFTASISSNIRIKHNIPDHPLPILADITQINQMLIHLYANSVQAMRDPEGIIEISLLQMRVDPEETIDPGQVLPGHYVVLNVSDNGIGMHPDLQKRVFDPFFTTKAPNANTGIGLFMVKAIVKSHNGIIRMSSEPRKGTQFHIFLPLITANQDREELFQHTQTSDLPKGSERILLVDDEEQIVKFEEEMLKSLGYHITAQTSSLQALKIFQKHPHQFDLVLTDEGMPEMTGSELAQHILSVRSDIPVILISGHQDKTLHATTYKGISAHLKKPLPRLALAETIRHTLDMAKANMALL